LFLDKYFFATTALVASTGVALADYSISGYAEMGYAGSNATEDQFHQDIVISFGFSGAMDNGTEFGATVHFDDNNGADDVSGNADFDGETVFIKGSMGTLTLGETDGAYDKAMSEVNFIGAINDETTSHAGFNGNSGLDGVFDDQVLRYDNAVGNVTYHVSLEQYDDTTSGENTDDVFGLGATLTTAMGASSVTIGAGYQTPGYDVTETLYGNTATLALEGDIVGLSAVIDLGNGLQFAGNYSMLDGDVTGTLNGATVASVDVDLDHVGIGASYTVDALTLAVNWGKYDADVNGTKTEADGVGVGINYDLGGGAVVQAGYYDDEDFDNSESDAYSIGLALSF
jgi:outer membrane protein OmpU